MMCCEREELTPGRHARKHYMQADYCRVPAVAAWRRRPPIGRLLLIEAVLHHQCAQSHSQIIRSVRSLASL